MKNKVLILLFLSLAIALAAQYPSSTAMMPINVSVTGFVANPGVYQLSVFSRLSDALELSRGKLPKPDNPLLLTPLEQKAADEDSLYTHHQGLREVRLTRQGQSEIYDLLRFMRLGELEQNPLLKDGDVIWVPALDKQVSVSGSVYLPGDYHFVEGDRLGDILALCQGNTPEADLKRVLIYRYQPNGIDFETITQDISQLADPFQASFVLQDKDRIIIGKDSEQRRGWKVTISGAVKTPGDFLIDENTRLWDVLQLCGGATQRGDLVNAVLISGQFSEKLFPDLLRLREFTITQMTPLEYSYIRTYMRQLQGKYSVDLQETWDSQGDRSNPTLSDGDYIFVPERFDMIAVNGQVKNPGLVPYVEGKDWKYYIAASGGYTNNRKANGVRIIRDHAGNWVKPSKKLQLQPGDMIFVPEKTDRDTWTDVKDVALLASQILTIFLSLRAILY